MKLWNINVRFDRSLKYITNPKKTNDESHVTGIHVSSDAKVCAQQMKRTKKRCGKENGVLAYHAVQSFHKDEKITAEQAHRIGVEYANRVWGDRFEVLVATHVDKEHIHTHFIWNSVSHIDGYKYHDNAKQNLKYLRNASDQICKENNLSIIESPQKSSKKTYQQHMDEVSKEKKSRELVKLDLDDAISGAKDFNEFIDNLKTLGYQVNTNGKHVSIRYQYNERPFRLYKMGKGYAEEDIIDRIQNQKEVRSLENNNPNCKPKDAKQFRVFLIRTQKRTVQKPYLVRRYLYYSQMLKRYSRNQSPYRTPKYIREDLNRLERFAEKTRLLHRNKIKTIFDCREVIKDKKQEHKILTDERQGLRVQIRNEKNPEQMKKLREDIRTLTQKINSKYREGKLLGEVLSEQEEMGEKMKLELQAIRTEPEKELDRKQRQKEKRFESLEL